MPETDSLRAPPPRAWSESAANRPNVGDRHIVIHSPYVLKWPILIEFSIYDDQQNAFADAFTNDLWVQKTLEGAWLGE